MEDIKGLYEGLCATCENSIRCETWAEWKCVVKEKRYNYAGPKECESYKKALAKFKRPRCQCEDCLKNGLLEEVEE